MQFLFETSKLCCHAKCQQVRNNINPYKQRDDKVGISITSHMHPYKNNIMHTFPCVLRPFILPLQNTTSWNITITPPISCTLLLLLLLLSGPQGQAGHRTRSVDRSSFSGRFPLSTSWADRDPGGLLEPLAST